MWRFIVGLVVGVGAFAVFVLGQNSDAQSAANVKRHVASDRDAAINQIIRLVGGYQSIAGQLIASGGIFSASDVSDVQSGAQFAADLLNKSNSLTDAVKSVAAKYPKLTLIITPKKQSDYREVERLLGTPGSKEKGMHPVETWNIFDWFHVGVSGNKVVSLRVECSRY